MKTKSIKAKREEWHRKACAFLGGIGTRLREPYWPSFEINTRAGRLQVGVHGGRDPSVKDDLFSNATFPWLACRFDDVDAARQILGSEDRLNPYTGKWNFMFDWDSTIESRLEYFGAQLCRVM